MPDDYFASSGHRPHRPKVDGRVIETPPVWSVLQYAGDGKWSFEEDRLGRSAIEDLRAKVLQALSQAGPAVDS